MKYTCAVCGKEFEAKHKSAVCSEECKMFKCIVCGRAFKRESPYTALTCSPTCRGIYRKQSGIAEASANKAHETIKMRYGVDNATSVSKPSAAKIWYGVSCSVRICQREDKRNVPFKVGEFSTY